MEGLKLSSLRINANISHKVMEWEITEQKKTKKTSPPKSSHLLIEGGGVGVWSADYF